MSKKYIRGQVNKVKQSDGTFEEWYMPLFEEVNSWNIGQFVPSQYGTGIGGIVRAGEDLEAGKPVYQQEGTTLMYMTGGDKRHELGYAGTDVKEGELFIPVPTWLPREGYPAFRKDK